MKRFDRVLAMAALTGFALIGISWTGACARVGFGGLSKQDGSATDGSATDGSATDGSASTFSSIALPLGGDMIEIALAEGAPSQLYLLAVGARVFRSTDRGKHWSACSPLPSTSSAALAVAKDGTIAIALWNGVFESRDHCATWQSTGGPSSANELLWLRNGDLFAAADDGLWRRRKNKWQALPSAADGRIAEDLATDRSQATLFAGTEDRGILRSRDGGASWQSINNGLPSKMNVYDLAVDPQASPRVFAALRGGLYRSKDGGDHWAEVRSGDAYSVAVDGSRVVIDSPQGFRYSDDGGDTFSNQDRRSATMGKARGRLRFDPEITGRLYAATGRGLFVSSVPAAAATSWSWQEQDAGISAWSLRDIVRQESSAFL